MNRAGFSITERNELVVKMFEKTKLNIEVRIFNHRNPVILYNGDTVLDCRFTKDKIQFVDGYVGEVFVEVDLKTESVSDEWLLDFITQYPQTKVYRIQYDDSPLYVSGYNFINRNNEETKYPVFSSKGCKIYFTKQHADEIAEFFSKKMNANLVVV